MFVLKAQPSVEKQKNAGQSIYSSNVVIAIILCMLALSMVLGWYGVAKTVAEIREVEYQQKIRDINRETKDKVHRIGEGSQSDLLDEETKSTEDNLQASIDAAEREVIRHRVQECGGLAA